MKKALLLSLFLTLISSFIFAQEKKRKWVLRANTGITLGVGNISIERAFATHHSFTLAPSFMYFKSEDLEYITYGGGVEYRYYFSSKKEAPKGFYTGAGAGFVKGNVDIKGKEETDVHGYTGQLIGGHQWIFKKGFTIDVNTGIQYLQLKIKNPTYKGSEFKGFLPALGVGIGYAF